MKADTMQFVSNFANSLDTYLYAIGMLLILFGIFCESGIRIIGKWDLSIQIRTGIVALGFALILFANQQGVIANNKIAITATNSQIDQLKTDCERLRTDLKKAQEDLSKAHKANADLTNTEYLHRADLERKNTQHRHDQEQVEWLKTQLNSNNSESISKYILCEHQNRRFSDGASSAAQRFSEVQSCILSSAADQDLASCVKSGEGAKRMSDLYKLISDMSKYDVCASTISAGAASGNRVNKSNQK